MHHTYVHCMQYVCVYVRARGRRIGISEFSVEFFDGGGMAVQLFGVQYRKNHNNIAGRCI